MRYFGNYNKNFVILRVPATIGLIFGVLGITGCSLGGYWESLGDGWGGQGVYGGSRGGPLFPLSSNVCPSGNLVRHQIWRQTPHDSRTG